MRQYRIKELNGVFTIETLVNYGIFGKKWEQVDYWGKYGWFFFTDSFLLNSFDSLEKAKEQIDKWIAKPKYHKYP